ncbi:MAG: zinc-ribbon domain-containing protein [Lachnospiraceae bacterium]|nr:zinc-ribbon domain-containing protein [Lachnospiraceae bacterium]
MFCKNCGKKLSDNSKFCQYCGTKTDFDVDFEKEDVEENVRTEEPVQKKDNIRPVSVVPQRRKPQEEPEEDELDEDFREEEYENEDEDEYENEDGYEDDEEYEDEDYDEEEYEDEDYEDDDDEYEDDEYDEDEERDFKAYIPVIAAVIGLIIVFIIAAVIVMKIIGGGSSDSSDSDKLAAAPSVEASETDIASSVSDEAASSSEASEKKETEEASESSDGSFVEDGKIHTYAFVDADVTWEEAWADAIKKGGYLAHINSDEECQYILNQISSRNTETICYLIGAKRDSDSKDYYWIAPDGSKVGDPIQKDSAFSSYWLSNEPSYKDENGVEECYLDMLYRKKDKRWYLNDVTNDIVSTSAYWKGKMGYIIEFDDNKVSD